MLHTKGEKRGAARIARNQDEYNWIFEVSSHPDTEPLSIPKIGEVVAVDVMMDTLFNARIKCGVYISIKEKVLGAKWHSLTSEEHAKVKAKYS